jgi:hypothetical protein
MNPYMQSFNNQYSVPANNYMYQQIPQMQQVSGLPGKIVNSDQDIAVNEIPMSGGPAIFPFGDMSKIITKQWCADGTIRTCIYQKLDFLEPPVNIESNKEIELNFEPILARLDTIEEQINKLMPVKRGSAKDGEAK